MADAELQSLVEARQLIEVELAGLAAERAGASEVQAITTYLDRMTTCAEVGQAEGFLEADVEFHFAVAQAAQNSILSQCMTLIRNLMLRWFSDTMLRLGVKKEALVEHREIADAIQDRAPAAARQAMMLHLQASVKRLLTAKKAHKAEDEVQ